MAALLWSAGIDYLLINRYRWLANTPRAHISNRRTMEVLHDLGREVEGEAYLHAPMRVSVRVLDRSRA